MTSSPRAGSNAAVPRPPRSDHEYGLTIVVVSRTSLSALAGIVALAGAGATAWTRKAVGACGAGRARGTAGGVTGRNTPRGVSAAGGGHGATRSATGYDRLTRSAGASAAAAAAAARRVARAA